MITPLLANVYLHYVLDEWFEKDVKPRLRGRAFEVRFADDAILTFSNEANARKVLEVLPTRFARHGLTLHPAKTRLVRFRPHREQRAETFDFLGFTHYWGKSRRGRWVVNQKTAKDRFKRTLKRLSLWCRANRYQPLLEQHRVLCRKLQGHFAYYGISGNYRALQDVVYQAQRLWIKWLRRRSQRGYFSWEKSNLLLKCLPLPKARIVHRQVFQ